MKVIVPAVLGHLNVMITIWISMRSDWSVLDMNESDWASGFEYK